MKKIFVLLLLVVSFKVHAQLPVLTKNGTLIDTSILFINVNAGVATRAIALTIFTSTDAPITISANSTVIFPAATLTASRVATINAGVNNGDRIELFNKENGFAWTLVGSPIYYNDGVTALTTVLANTITEAKWLNGKYQITN